MAQTELAKLIKEADDEVTVMVNCCQGALDCYKNWQELKDQVLELMTPKEKALTNSAYTKFLFLTSELGSFNHVLQNAMEVFRGGHEDNFPKG